MSETDERPPPSWGSESRTAVLASVAIVMVGAPVGLLWATAAPPVEAVVAAGGATSLAQPASDSFIAVDGFFLGLAVLAGLLSGVVVWLLSGRARSGPGAVVGLVVGGLLAAEVARATGELVDAGQAQAVVDAGREAVVQLPVRLRAESARAAWPVAALAAHMVLTAGTARVERERAVVGSG